MDLIARFGYPLIIVAIILLGMWVRVRHLFIVPMDQPYRLGGLFLEFSEQIIANRFLLPHTIPYYSSGGLPFAYPPLSFYVQSVLIKLFNPAPFLTVNLLPPIVSALGVPAFFWLVRQVFKTRVEVVAALLAYALMPNVFIEQIEAAGLAESFGGLFLVLYTALLWRTYFQPKLLNVILAGLGLGLCVLSSPGSVVAAPVVSGLFALAFLWKALRSKEWRLILPLVRIGLVGIVISAPYWLWVMAQHGKGIFIVPLLAQFRESAQAVSPFEAIFSQLASFTIAGGQASFPWDVLILLGLLFSLLGSAPLVGVMFLVAVFLPREGRWIAAFTAALLVGYSLPVLLSLIRARLDRWHRGWRWAAGTVMAGAFIIVAGFNAMDRVDAYIDDRQWLLPAGQVSELRSLKTVIPEDGKVIILGNDALAEWAPHLLERETLNSVYGLEWQPNELERVTYFNSELVAAEDASQILTAANEFLGVSDFYLVTNDKPKAARLLESSKAGTVDMIADGPSINVVHISGP